MTKSDPLAVSRVLAGFVVFERHESCMMTYTQNNQALINYIPIHV